MAGDWIKMSTSLITHPKVVRISSALKADRLRVVGGLYAAWSVFDTHSEDGILDGVGPDALDELIGWPGFAAAMQSVGWVSTNGESVVLPRFDEHNGQSAKRRAQENQRKRDIRNVSASEADTVRTREEKRREEKRREEEETKEQQVRPKVIAQPETGRATKKCPKAFELTEELVAWAQRFTPGIDPHKELEKLRDHTFGTARTDWAGTWRNWMRKAFDDTPQGATFNGRTPAFAKGAAIEAHNQAVVDRMLKNEGKPDEFQ